MKHQDALNFNEGWRFAITAASGVEREDFRDDRFAGVTLPHDWQILNRRDPDMEMGWSQGYYPRNEVGWYRKRFDVPESWSGRRVRLFIEGCQRFYDIYLNGRRVGGHRYGYVPYVCDLSDGLRFGGQNLLCVRVNNADTLGDRWYSGAGLYRDVRLLVDDPVHITALRAEYTIADDRADVLLECDIENCTRMKADAVLTAVLTGPDGDTLASDLRIYADAGHSTHTLTFPVNNIRRWDVDDPALYALTLTLESEGQTADTVTETLGFRTFSFDCDSGFTLNGRIRKLYGADLHHDGGVCFGAAVPPSVLRRRLLKLKQMGCNAIRGSHNPHSEALCDLCDELGFVMIDELYDKWCDSALYFDKLFYEDRMDDLHTLIARDRNHPSVMIWSVGNEVEIQYQEHFYKYLRELCDECRRVDPSRPVSLALIGFCLKGAYDDFTPLRAKMDAVLRYAEIADVFMGNYMENFYSAMREAGMRKSIIGSEVFSYYRHAELTATGIIAQSPWADVDDRPYVAGGFVWAGVDYLGESSGYPVKGWTGCPIDSAGFWKLRAWHLASQWLKTPVLRVGILDDTAYDDRPTANWGFPLMKDMWRGWREGRMLHVCVMTNCDDVRLYVNSEPVRVSGPDAPDRMAHFYIPYRPGILRAEGWLGGRLAAAQELRTTAAPDAVRLQCLDKREDVFHIEASLLDEAGQLWTCDSPAVAFTVAGGAVLVGVDNGDLVGEHDPHAAGCPFHLGHAVAYLRRVNGDPVTVNARCGGLDAVLKIE